MITVFEGNYFDGTSAKLHVVKIVFAQNALQLYTEDRHTKRLITDGELHKAEFIGNDRILIRLNEDSGELLDVTSIVFVQQFKENFPHISGSNWLEKIADSGWKGIAAITLSLIAAIILVYMYAVPALGEFSAQFVPQKYETQLGETIFNNMIKNYKVDSLKTKQVNELIKHVDFKTTYKLKMVVINEDVKNAFALPGGYIVIYSGILKDMKSYDELMGLLAHEVSHVKHRHSLRNIFRSLAGYVFISIILNDINGLSAIMIENINNIKGLSYSRSLEEEADNEGLKIMFHNKFDPQGMILLFQQLKKEGDMPGELAFLSTHPLTDNRIQNIQSQIKTTPHKVLVNNNMQAIWKEMK